MRALTIRAIRLQPDTIPVQTDLFTDFARHERQQKIDKTVLAIRRRYGKNGIFNACLLSEHAIPQNAPDFAVLPGMPYK